MRTHTHTQTHRHTDTHTEKVKRKEPISRDALGRLSLLNTRSNININPLRYISITSSIKSFLKNKPNLNFEKQWEHPPPFDHILKSKKGANLIYKQLTNLEKEQEPTGFFTWKKQINISKEDWKRMFENKKEPQEIVN